jgi:uncharacterized protein
MRRNTPFALIAAAVVSVAAVACAWILGTSFVQARASQTLTVTGSARRSIRSDFIIWSAVVTQRGADQVAAYKALKPSVDKTVAYLRAKGLGEDEIVTSAVSSRKLFAPRPPGSGYEGEDTMREVVGYELRQTVEVRSEKVDLVDKIARESTDLISQGIQLDSSDPQYIYTKIGDLKVEILAEAAKDARRRADEIAKSSGATITGVRAARMSPLQITPVFSTEISGEGINDTSSLDKAITAIVTMGFGVR